MNPENMTATEVRNHKPDPLQSMIAEILRCAKTANAIEQQLFRYRTTLEHIARIDTVMEDGGGFKFEVMDRETGDWSTKETKTLNPDEAMLEVIRLARLALSK